MPKFTIGVDIGGTKIHAGLVSSTGKVLSRKKIPTEAFKGKAAILANTLTAIKAVWASNVQAIGIGIAGVVEAQKGLFISGPNLPDDFRNNRLAAFIQKEFDLPASIDNDVHCFTLAEAIFGSAKGFSKVVGLTIGTGVGGGIVIDKQPYRGRNNAAGELGHMIIEASSPVECSCGKKGHLEALVSGAGLTKLYAKETGINLEASAIEQAAAAGDETAKRLLTKASESLAVGLANIIHILNPDIITVGGGAIRGSSLFSTAAALYKKLLISPMLASTPVKKSKLGDDAGIIGASLIVKARK